MAVSMIDSPSPLPGSTLAAMTTGSFSFRGIDAHGVCQVGVSSKLPEVIAHRYWSKRWQALTIVDGEGREVGGFVTPPGEGLTWWAEGMEQ